MNHESLIEGGGSKNNYVASIRCAEQHVRTSEVVRSRQNSHSNVPCAIQKHEDPVLLQQYAVLEIRTTNIAGPAGWQARTKIVPLYLLFICYSKWNSLHTVYVWFTIIFYTTRILLPFSLNTSFFQFSSLLSCFVNTPIHTCTYQLLYGYSGIRTSISLLSQISI